MTLRPCTAMNMVEWPVIKSNHYGGIEIRWILWIDPNIQSNGDWSGLTDYKKRVYKLNENDLIYN